MDIGGALLALVVLSPLFLLIAAYMVIVSPGPVFFRQSRVGYRGRNFMMLKFRTMPVDSDTSRHQQCVSQEIATDQPLTKLDHDQQVIPLGLIIRKSCLDELPQLINVLRGEMSLIGPRPDPVYGVREYQAWHTARFDVLPGMTGLWQVSGKNRTTFKQMVRLDIAYVKRRSFWLDVKILLKTPSAILTQFTDTVLTGNTSTHTKSVIPEPHVSFDPPSAT